MATKRKTMGFSSDTVTKNNADNGENPENTRGWHSCSPGVRQRRRNEIVSDGSSDIGVDAFDRSTYDSITKVKRKPLSIAIISRFFGSSVSRHRITSRPVSDHGVSVSTLFDAEDESVVIANRAFHRGVLGERVQARTYRK